MDSNKPAQLQSGGGQLKTLDEFTQLCESEFAVKHNAMIAEYKERKNNLQLSKERKVAEYSFINDIVSLNTLIQNNEVNTELVMKLESELAQLDFENIAASFPLDYWRVEFGEKFIVPIICDVVNYFLNQFQVKEMLTDVQIVQLSIRLLASQPRLRVMELVYVLKEALAGTYGPTYQRVGIDTIQGWLAKFYEQSAIHLETKRMNGKPEESRGSAPWVEQEKMLKKYEQEQRDKKAITDKVWHMESQNRKVEEHKEKVLHGKKG